MTETSFKIPHRWRDAPVYECVLPPEIAAKDFREQERYAVEKAVADRASLVGANLQGARLEGASLVGARLVGANLDRASLVGANLDRASLVGANLDGANLDGASLVGANLDGANLDGASLVGASLDGARLDGANLDGARLTPIKQDFLAEVLRLPAELENLRAALIEGRVYGSTYTGSCACLAGTLCRNTPEVCIENGAEIGPVQFHIDASSPREMFFTAIKAGDTPETNPASKIALEWTDEAIAIRDNIVALCGRKEI